MSEKSRLWREPQVHQIINFVICGGQLFHEDEAMGNLVRDKTQLAAKTIFRRLPEAEKHRRIRWEKGLYDSEVMEVVTELTRLSVHSDPVSFRLRQVGIDGSCIERTRAYFNDPSFPQMLKEFSSRKSSCRK